MSSPVSEGCVVLCRAVECWGRGCTTEVGWDHCSPEASSQGFEEGMRASLVLEDFWPQESAGDVPVQAGGGRY